MTSQSFSRQIIESLEGYAVFTTDTQGIVNSWNSGAQRIFGYTEKEIIEKNASILFVPEDIKKNNHTKELADAARTGQAKDEKWHLRKDGSRFWASGLVFPLKDADGKLQGFTKIARDMTEKKKYEEERLQLQKELERERRKLVDIFVRAPTFMAILRGNDHVFEMVNAAYYQLVGHKKIIGKPVREAMPEVIEQGFIQVLDTVIATGEPFIGREIPIKLQRGKKSLSEERYVDFIYEPLKDANGKRTGIVAHGYDVTDQVIARKKAEESEKKLRFMADSMPQQVWTATPDGALDYVNQYTVKYFHKKAEEIIGEGWQKVIHPDDLPGCVTLWTESLQTGQPYQVFFRLRRSDGIFRWHLGRALPLMNEKKVLKWFGTNTDVDDQKKLEKQKDDFLGIASHELKTPVTSIKAYGQVLETMFKRQGDIKAAEMLRKMGLQINKLTNLIEDLLDVTKIQSGKLQFHEEYFDFNELIREIVEEIQRITEKHHISVKLAGTKKIYGDRERIGQVLTNLITNAMKYSPHAEKIIVKTIIHIKNVTLCVQDFGVGIPKDKRDKIFEQFFRVSGPAQDTFPGLGLGLYISSEIIKREGGRIWVESVEGKGSTFCFRLPTTKKQI